MNKLLEEAARYLGEEIPSLDDETDEQGPAWDHSDDLWNFLLSIRVQIQGEVDELHGREELEEVDQVQDESDTSMPALESRPAPYAKNPQYCELVIRAVKKYRYLFT